MKKLYKSRKHQLYQTLVAEYKKAHGKLSHNQCDIDVSNIWNGIKSEGNWEKLIQAEINKCKIQSKEGTLKLDKFWGGFFAKKHMQGTATTNTQNPSTVASNSTATDGQTAGIISIGEEDKEHKETAAIIPTATEMSYQKSTTGSSSIELEETHEQPTAGTIPIATKVSQQSSFPEISFKTPSQDQIKLNIASLNNEIVFLYNKKSNGFASDEEVKRLKELREKLSQEERKLKIKADGQERQKRKREHDRKVLAEIQLKHPEVSKMFGKKKQKAGRPRCEEDQPELLQAIVDIATYGCGADEKRRSNMLRSIHTLDELTAELNSQGFQVKRSAVYLRLLPRSSSSAEGKRHITTVPVKLVRATNDLHNQHVDTKFCTAAISYLEEIASVLGPNEVLWISQDDKARVPLGKTAANKQTPLVMHLEYRIQLPDHDWVIAEKHKLIPSVYAFINIDPEKSGDRKAVTYSGPTYIAIRSAKHCSSTAYSHAKDMETLMEREEFEQFCKNDSGQYKPIVMITTDGGPDENPRYKKRIECAISEFRKFNLDALFVATNAPGRSAFNRVERRMAPLSRDLAGLIIDHKKLGNHLNEKGETIDTELEKKNFAEAGKILADIWSETIIDKYPTVATYVPPEESEISAVPDVEQSWKSAHIREGHYFLQIVKCSDRTCCSEPRSSIFNLLKQFIPAPMCICQPAYLDDNRDLNDKFPSLFLRMNLSDEKYQVGVRKEVPFDTSCPSLREIVQSRTCECGIQHSSKRSLGDHLKTCVLRKQTLAGVSTKKVNPSKTKSFVKYVRSTKSISSTLSARPRRLAAIRQGEKMIIWTSRLNAEHVDWFDDDCDDVDASNLKLPHIQKSDQIPIIDIEKNMTCRWQEI